MKGLLKNNFYAAWAKARNCPEYYKGCLFVKLEIYWNYRLFDRE